VRPIGFLKRLNTRVTLRIVSGKVERRLEGRADEALMIIGRRVDQVSDYLLTRPAAGQQWLGALKLAD
jgi:hypothetical protein